MAVTMDRLAFVSLEITGRCQLHCAHCYASSGPDGDHGSMTVDDWRRVIDEAAELGVERIQIIGGEPTVHPTFATLAQLAVDRHPDVEVYSNLARSLSDGMWRLFERPGFRLATSYYSDDPEEHDTITMHRGAHRRTLANIREALRRNIPLRVGVIAIEQGQRARAAVEQLRALGVAQIDYDELRQLGRGVRDREPEQIDQLCGGCGHRRLAISPDGDVWPCPMARWIRLGNVRHVSLASVYETSTEVRRGLQAHLHDSDRDDPDGGCTAPLCCDPHLKPKN